MSDIQSKPYQPDPAQCCQACVFGRGQHAWWCLHWTSRWFSYFELVEMKWYEFDELQMVKDDPLAYRSLVRRFPRAEAAD